MKRCSTCSLLSWTCRSELPGVWFAILSIQTQTGLCIGFLINKTWGSLQIKRILISSSGPSTYSDWTWGLVVSERWWWGHGGGGAVVRGWWRSPGRKPLMLDLYVRLVQSTSSNRQTRGAGRRLLQPGGNSGDWQSTSIFSTNVQHSDNCSTANINILVSCTTLQKKPSNKYAHQSNKTDLFCVLFILKISL